VLDREVIQNRGFRNVTAGGRVTGFQLELRNPNYRGTPGSLLDGIDVVVDGEKWECDQPTWTLQEHTFALAELRASTDVRWQLDETAVVTVPRPGGLAPGVHDVDVAIYLRRPDLPPFVARSVFRATAKRVIVPGPPADGPRYGVSLRSFAGDLHTSMTLDDAMADIADLGATGIAILGEGDIPGYPQPDAIWLRDWHRQLDRFGLTATNYGCWVDTAMWLDRDLTAVEAADRLRLDLRLAARLGFTSIRPTFGVVSAELDPHPVWREAVERSLDLAADLGIVICPEIRSPTPIRHRVTDAYLDFIAETGTHHFKLLVDTGIFRTAPLDDGLQGRNPLAVPIGDLAEILPHVHFIQATFYEIDDALIDPHVPWSGILGTLAAAGWSGWLSSEYDGRREAGRGRDQIRRQHALLRELHAPGRPRD
jgi:sugar phosphate isomerase/epimerase